MTSQTEENYLKVIYKISEKTTKPVSTKSIAAEFKIAAASVTEMLKRLAEKDLVNHEKYKGVTLTKTGAKMATSLIRRHRLWEVFLVDKLHFAWDEVHEIAEELEHVKSQKLTRRLDAFLGFPKYDPHGGPIPDEDGQFMKIQQTLLSKMDIGEQGVLIGVQEDSKSFLQYLDKVKLGLGTKIELLQKFEYDDSICIRANNEDVVISNKVSQNLFIKCN